MSRMGSQKGGMSSNNTNNSLLCHCGKTAGTLGYYDKNKELCCSFDNDLMYIITLHFTKKNTYWHIYNTLTKTFTKSQIKPFQNN